MEYAIMPAVSTAVYELDMLATCLWGKNMWINKFMTKIMSGIILIDSSLRPLTSFQFSACEIFSVNIYPRCKIKRMETG